MTEDMTHTTTITITTTTTTTITNGGLDPRTEADAWQS